MSETRNTVSKLIIPFSLSLIALQDYPLEDALPIPSKNYDLPIVSKRYSWEETKADQYYDLIGHNRYQIIRRFTENILKESVDIPPEFSKAINDEFWNIL